MKITYSLMKLHGVFMNDQLLVHYVFQAYLCNSVLMNWKKNPHRGDIANRGDINAISRTSVSRPFQRDTGLSP